jgi:tight adherence protein B
VAVLILAVLIAGAAVWIWPTEAIRRAGAGRARVLAAGLTLRIGGLGAAPAGVLAAVAAGAVGSAAGAAAAVAAALVGACLVVLVVRAVARARERRRRAAERDAIGMLIRELQAGAAADTALAAAVAAVPAAAGILRDPAVGMATNTSDGPADGLAARLAAGRQLATTIGVPWAAVLTEQVADLQAEAAAAAERASLLAGPRMSGYVLAALPALGLALGFGMGVDPVQILLHTSVGSVLLLAGCLLGCAGLVWVERIVR